MEYIYKDEELLIEALTKLGIKNPEPKVIYNNNPTIFASTASSAPLEYFNKLTIEKKTIFGNAKNFGESLKTSILNIKPKYLDSIEVAGNGYINFIHKPYTLLEVIKANYDNPTFGQNGLLNGQKIMVEYTDPNPFKELHIGHLMSNTIGESLSRLLKMNGAEVKNACYQGDMGLHVAKSIWGLKKLLSENGISIKDLALENLKTRIKYMGNAYVLGTQDYDNPNLKFKIDELNKIIYESRDKEVHEIFSMGRKWSLEYFETQYSKLGTRFDYYFFESEEGIKGKEIVLKNLTSGIFKESQGAIIFEGETEGLHTRVFINKYGIPTYEAKELGLAYSKYEKYKYDKSFVVTGNEITDYYKVVMAALNKIDPELVGKIKHLPHGMLRLNTGKMSSRKGNIITPDTLISAVKKQIDKISKEEFSTGNDENELIAIGAIKYSILKNSIGKDIIFDPKEAISITGNTGPYLMYTAVRANSVIEKSGKNNITVDISSNIEKSESLVLSKLIQFERVIKIACQTYSPSTVCTYLFELAQLYNSFYNANKIIGSEHENLRLALTKMTSIVITNGLHSLGIKVPGKM